MRTIRLCATFLFPKGTEGLLDECHRYVENLLAPRGGVLVDLSEVDSCSLQFAIEHRGGPDMVGSLAELIAWQLCRWLLVRGAEDAEVGWQVVEALASAADCGHPC